MGSGESLHAVETVILLLLVLVAGFAVLARRLRVPYPIVLVLAGLAISFVPRMPHVPLDPNIVFVIFLPPLLYASAWTMSWREFRRNAVMMGLLAVGLVCFTVWGIAEFSDRFITALDWKAGFLLGAVVATTDAIAATTIARRVGLPQRIVDILEGESLLNDATGLLALEFGIAMVVEGTTPTITSGLLRITYLTGVGIAVGLILGFIVEWFERRIDDGPIEIVMSILTPYAAYLAAETIHASGVLAVVACGLYLSRQSSQFLSPSVRMQAGAVWDSLTFVLNGLVFMLIGLQLPYVLAGLPEYNIGELVLYGGLFSLLLIVLRLVWMYPGAYLANVIRRRVLHQSVPMPSAKQIFVVGWTGMRGVVALAAAIALPETLANGSAFPQRNLIVFLTFSVILVTLVVQGLTLPPLIRALGMGGAGGEHAEEDEARRIITSAALAQLEEARGGDLPEFGAVYEDIARRYTRRLASLSKESAENEEMSTRASERYRTVLKEMLRVERKTAVRLRNDGRINDEVLRKLEHELDLSEMRIALS